MNNRNGRVSGSRYVPTTIEYRRIARDEEHKPVIIEAVEGTQRYVYENGTVDKRSIVDSRIPTHIVAGIVHNVVKVGEPAVSMVDICPKPDPVMGMGNCIVHVSGVHQEPKVKF